MTPRSTLARLLLVAAVALASAPALAAPPPAPAARTLRDDLAGPARDAFDRGTRLYKEGRYEEARAAFLEARDASGDARVLFNAAVCDKAQGRYARALETIAASLEALGPGVDPGYRGTAEEAIAALSRRVAFVTLAPSIRGAEIRVDGERVTRDRVALDEGRHRISATAPDHEPVEIALDVTAGESRTVELALRPSPPSGAVEPAPAAPAAARLRVSTDRAADAVSVDGRFLGSGRAEVELPPGTHHVVVARSGGGSRAVDVTLRPREVRDVRVSLPEESRGISPWWFVGGGALLAAGVTTAVILANGASTPPTRFEGSTAGTLAPYLVPATRGGSR